MKGSVKRWLKDIPYFKQVFNERDQLRSEVDNLRAALAQSNLEKTQLLADKRQLKEQRNQLKANQFYEPGHFHSPVPDVAEMRSREQEIFDRPDFIPGINLRENEQISLLQKLERYYSDLPFEATQKAGLRFYFENSYYSYSDAVFLFLMMRHLQPQQIIEIGSGYSSCLMLDVNQLFFKDSINCTFIDPNPQRLLSLITERDRSQIEVIPAKVQEVDRDRFRSLQSGDILFIDSTHVAKTGSDVNYIFSEILPSLQTGVYIHIHDIFYPFEYLREWVFQGWGWNECYFVKAFLQYNRAFEIVLFNTFLEHQHPDWFYAHMPLCMKNLGGSIWLQKVGD